MTEFKLERALISVHNKTGIVELARLLVENGVEILSSGGTAKVLRRAGIKVMEVSEYTGAKEIFGGRVKTLHPRIHGGILMRREFQSDVAQATANNILPIDLVVVNLYPFAEKAAKEVSEEEALEEIDIGGAALLRAGAKNYPGVATICHPQQYDEFIQNFKGNTITLELRRKWAGEVFAYITNYDAIIQNYFQGEKQFFLAGQLYQPLRYGENPHQQAYWYKTHPSGLSDCQQLGGKGLSYVNLLDLDTAYRISWDFSEPFCVIIKHATPCGMAVGKDPLEAYRRAFSCDTRSPFGGVVGFNRKVDFRVGKELSGIFLEAIIAPQFEGSALELLKKKSNLRLLEWGAEGEISGAVKFTSISGGFLLQDGDDRPIVKDDFQVVTQIPPTAEQLEALIFGAKAVKWAKSNAVVLCNRYQTLGIGAGQTSRVGAVEIAVANAERFGHDLNGAIMASDAFFPFPDSVEEAAKVGVKAIVQPGGSVKDREVIKAADDLGLAMVFSGKRHFRH